MALTTRQRRPLPSDPPPSSPIYTKYDKPSRRLGDGGREEEKSLGWFVPVFALGMLRYMSATTNIIHDCDEVFNYWEPLHYLLYKSGFQTWEYRQLLLRITFYFFCSFRNLIKHLIDQSSNSAVLCLSIVYVLILREMIRTHVQNSLLDVRERCP